MKQNYGHIFVIISFVCFSFLVAYSEESALTFRLVHPENDMLSHLPQSEARVDKNQYECFTKGGENYWVNRKVELDINDIKGAKIEMEIWPLYSYKERTIEIPSEGFPNVDLEKYGHAFKVEIIFNQRSWKKLENVTEKNIGRRLAIIYRGELLIAPIIHDRLTEGKLVIIGLPYAEAKRLKNATGKSPSEDNPTESDDEKISQYNMSIEINPNDVMAYNNRGNAYVRKGQYDQAILDYTKALEIDPKYEIAFYNRGIAYMGKGQYEKAISDFNKAIGTDPKHSKAYYYRGNAYMEKSQYEQAIADYSKAIEINPNDPNPYNNLAWILATAKESKYRNGKKAVELAIKACELSGWKDQYSLGTLAAAYARIGDFDNAIKWQKKALESYGKSSGSEKAKLRMEGEQRLNFYLGRKPWSE